MAKMQPLSPDMPLSEASVIKLACFRGGVSYPFPGNLMAIEY